MSANSAAMMPGNRTQTDMAIDVASDDRVIGLKWRTGTTEVRQETPYVNVNLDTTSSHQINAHAYPTMIVIKATDKQTMDRV